MLIVLDNARDAEQVRPLLPGAPGCLVLVTSRNQLTGLVAADGAQLLTLDVLDRGEAGELLAAPPRREPGWRRARRGRRAHRAVRAGCRWPWRSLPPAPPPGPASRWPRWPPSSRRPHRARRPGRRRSRHRRAGRVLLVLSGAECSRGADVPAARPPPGPRHLRRRRRQPGRRPAEPRGTALLGELPAPTWSPSTPRPVSPATTCCAPTRRNRPRAMDDEAEPRRATAGCSTTTCTPPAAALLLNPARDADHPAARCSPASPPEWLADGRHALAWFDRRAPASCSPPPGLAARAGSTPRLAAALGHGRIPGLARALG